MHPNDVQLIRVYPREKGGRVLEETLPSDSEFEIVIEAKAGEAMFGTGGKYLIQIIVRDLTDFSVVFKGSLSGHLAREPWDKPALLYTFPIPVQGAAKEFHILEVLASLCVGVRNPNVSIAKSSMFIICRP